MDKTVDTVNDLCKSTKACDRNNSSLNYLTYLIVSLEDLPWILRSLLYVNETFFVSLSISLIVTVILSPTETTSEGCLILFQERSDSSDKTVNTTEIYEYAVICDRLNCTLYLRTDLSCLKELSLSSLLFPLLLLHG